MLSRADVARLHALKQRGNATNPGCSWPRACAWWRTCSLPASSPDWRWYRPPWRTLLEGAALAAALHSRVRTETTDHELARLAGTDTPQGVVVAAEIPRRDLASVPLTDRALVVLLDAVQDPGNFGTIVRSADAFGAALVCALPGTVDPWNPKAVRSAAGSSLRVPVVEADMGTAMKYLCGAGFRVVGAEPTAHASTRCRRPRAPHSCSAMRAPASAKPRVVSSMARLPCRSAARPSR
jgi:hypothetical protein